MHHVCHSKQQTGKKAVTTENSLHSNVHIPLLDTTNLPGTVIVQFFSMILALVVTFTFTSKYYLCFCYL